ncbi:MAG TPA: Holliday junction resolvase RuvX [Egibacteraceae bacterium]|nr:Holliday junction resolvase RuvX [Egibacteraceae bacterium]
MGVDVGAVRAGVAVSDAAATVASPHATIEGGDGLARRLANLARDLACDTVVVGLPKGMSGRDTASTRAARVVANELSEQGFDVHLWDERLSSAEAERLLLEAGRRRRQRRDERDRVAAAIILQGWLDARGGAA